MKRKEKDIHIQEKQLGFSFWFVYFCVGEETIAGQKVKKGWENQ